MRRRDANAGAATAGAGPIEGENCGWALARALSLPAAVFDVSMAMQVAGHRKEPASTGHEPAHSQNVEPGSSENAHSNRARLILGWASTALIRGTAANRTIIADGRVWSLLAWALGSSDVTSSTLAPGLMQAVKDCFKGAKDTAGEDLPAAIAAVLTLVRTRFAGGFRPPLETCAAATESALAAAGYMPEESDGAPPAATTPWFAPATEALLLFVVLARAHPNPRKVFDAGAGRLLRPLLAARLAGLGSPLAAAAEALLTELLWNPAHLPGYPVAAAAATAASAAGEPARPAKRPRRTTPAGDLAINAGSYHGVVFDAIRRAARRCDAAVLNGLSWMMQTYTAAATLAAGTLVSGVPPPVPVVAVFVELTSAVLATLDTIQDTPQATSVKRGRGRTLVETPPASSAAVMWCCRAEALASLVGALTPTGIFGPPPSAAWTTLEKVCTAFLEGGGASTTTAASAARGLQSACCVDVRLLQLQAGDTDHLACAVRIAALASKEIGGNSPGPLLVASLTSALAAARQLPALITAISIALVNEADDPLAGDGPIILMSAPPVQGALAAAAGAVPTGAAAAVVAALAAGVDTLTGRSVPVTPLAAWSTAAVAVLDGLRIDGPAAAAVGAAIHEFVRRSLSPWLSPLLENPTAGVACGALLHVYVAAVAASEVAQGLAPPLDGGDDASAAGGAGAGPGARPYFALLATGTHPLPQLANVMTAWGASDPHPEIIAALAGCAAQRLGQLAEGLARYTGDDAGGGSDDDDDDSDDGAGSTQVTLGLGREAARRQMIAERADVAHGLLGWALGEKQDPLAASWSAATSSAQLWSAAVRPRLRRAFWRRLLSDVASGDGDGSVPASIQASLALVSSPALYELGALRRAFPAAWRAIVAQDIADAAHALHNTGVTVAAAAVRDAGKTPTKYFRVLPTATPGDGPDHGAQSLRRVSRMMDLVIHLPLAYPAGATGVDLGAAINAAERAIVAGLDAVPSPGRPLWSSALTATRSALARCVAEPGVSPTLLSSLASHASIAFMLSSASSAATTAMWGPTPSLVSSTAAVIQAAVRPLFVGAIGDDPGVRVALAGLVTTCITRQVESGSPPAAGAAVSAAAWGAILSAAAEVLAGVSEGADVTYVMTQARRCDAAAAAALAAAIMPIVPAATGRHRDDAVMALGACAAAMRLWGVAGVGVPPGDCVPPDPDPEPDLDDDGNDSPPACIVACGLHAATAAAVALYPIETVDSLVGDSCARDSALDYLAAASCALGLARPRPPAVVVCRLLAVLLASSPRHTSRAWQAAAASLAAACWAKPHQAALYHGVETTLWTASGGGGGGAAAGAALQLLRCALDAPLGRRAVQRLGAAGERLAAAATGFVLSGRGKSLDVASSAQLLASLVARDSTFTLTPAAIARAMSLPGEIYAPGSHHHLPPGASGPACVAWSSLYASCGELLAVAVRHRPEDARRAMAAYTGGGRAMLAALVTASRAVVADSRPDIMAAAAAAARSLNRVYEEAGAHPQLGKYCAHLLADYLAATAAEIPLTRAVSQGLQPGAMALMAACSHYELQHLHAAAGGGGAGGGPARRAALATLKEAYDRGYAYAGKV